MSIKKIIPGLTFSLLLASGVAASTEPTDCYKMVRNELRQTQASAIKLCSGTKAASETLICFLEAWKPRDQDGLGLTVSSAVNLCKSNSEPFKS
jgi:hypothetical protein